MICEPLFLDLKRCKLFALQTKNIDEMNVKELKNYITKLVQEKNEYENLATSFEDLHSYELLNNLKKYYNIDTFELKEQIIDYAKQNSTYFKLKTNDIVDKISKIGFGSDSFYLSNPHYAIYEIYAKKYLINPKKTYTKEEISELVKDKNVIVVNIEPSNKPVNLKPDSLAEMKKHLSQIDIVSPYLNFDEIESDEEIKDNVKNTYALNIIKSEFDAERLDNDFKTYMTYYNNAKTKYLKAAYDLIKNEQIEIENKNASLEELKDVIKE